MVSIGRMRESPLSMRKSNTISNRRTQSHSSLDGLLISGLQVRVLPGSPSPLNDLAAVVASSDFPNCSGWPSLRGLATLCAHVVRSPAATQRWPELPGYVRGFVSRALSFNKHALARTDFLIFEIFCKPCSSNKALILFSTLRDEGHQQEPSSSATSFAM
jgi:hypothetical protein